MYAIKIDDYLPKACCHCPAFYINSCMKIVKCTALDAGYGGTSIDISKHNTAKVRLPNCPIIELKED